MYAAKSARTDQEGAQRIGGFHRKIQSVLKIIALIFSELQIKVK